MNYLLLCARRRPPPAPRERDARNQRDEPPTATKWRMSTHLFLAITLMAVGGADKHLCRTRPPPRSSVWRACDRRTTTATRRRHAQLNLKWRRRAEKDADRRCLGQVDEPNAQRVPRGRYLRIRHQTDEQAHERESVRLNRTAQQWRTRACQIIAPPRSFAPLDLRNGRPLGHLNTTAFPLRSPRPSDPSPRRSLALAGMPAPRDAPRSTSTRAFHRARPMRGRDA